MRHVECVVIGAGQSGLAMSRCLAGHGVDHVVLERGRLAERWRSERWDSLRLLTPNWQSRLPGFRYEGPDPDGYMTMPEVVGYFERYAASFDPPVECGVEVRSVTGEDGAYRVETTKGSWSARSLVIATGHSQLPSVPALASRLSPDLTQITPTSYRRPSQLPAGGVLVAGASASGLQLADELLRDGRDVTIAVGHHTRLPRTYRGRDILYWLDRMGVFSETLSQVYDVEISRKQPSLQLIGHPDRVTLDLKGLRDRGAVVAGRLIGAEGPRVHFDDDLVATTASADIKLAILLRRVDAFIAAKAIPAPPAPPFVPHCLAFAEAPRSVHLERAGIRTVIWATGFRREYSWLHLPVFDAHGEIAHDGGVTRVPGVYVIGLHFLRRRNSSFIDGVGADAQDLSQHLASYLGHDDRHATSVEAAMTGVRP